MPLWFVRGLRRGVVTTRYPGRPDPSAADLPTPPCFRPERLDRQVAERRRQRIAGQSARSLHVRTLDTGCCAACEQEIRLLAAPHYDLHRLGFFSTPAPRHADLLMVTGPMIRAFGIAARKTYDAMPG